jgi:hypothetical protein
MAEMKTLNGYEVVDAAARADIELLKAKDTAIQADLNNHNHSYNDLTDKPTIPSTEGLASEVYVTNYVNNAIANIDIPEADDCKLVYIGTRLTADEAKAKIKSVLEAGKIPVYQDMLYTGQGNADLGTNSTDFYYHFSSTGLSKTYPGNEETIVMRYTKFYPNRTQPWDMGYVQRLVRYQEFKALEERVAALEGGTN